MAWQTSARTDRNSALPADWSTRRIRVLRRDGYKCQARDSTGSKCEAPANQCDHIKAGDDHSLENLQALCVWHHGRKSSAEGAAARRPAISRYRRPEAHPGAL